MLIASDRYSATNESARFLETTFTNSRLYALPATFYHPTTSQRHPSGRLETVDGHRVTLETSLGFVAVNFRRTTEIFDVQVTKTQPTRCQLSPPSYRILHRRLTTSIGKRFVGSEHSAPSSPPTAEAQSRQESRSKENRFGTGWEWNGVHSRRSSRNSFVSRTVSTERDTDDIATIQWVPRLIWPTSSDI